MTFIIVELLSELSRQNDATFAKSVERVDLWVYFVDFREKPCPSRFDGCLIYGFGLRKGFGGRSRDEY